MHSYPAWKVWLVAIVLFVAALFALPNLYGDAPALQLSRNDRAAVTEADRGSVTAALAGKKIPIEASYLSEDRLVLRFHMVEQQLVARDVLQESMGEDYLVALSHVPRTPGWVRAIGLKPMSLGLDLRGGVHFLYEVDVAGAVKQLLSGMERDYRTLLRDERIPFTGVRNNGVDTVTMELRSATDAERATAAIRRQDPTLSVTTSATGEGSGAHGQARARSHPPAAGFRNRAEHHDAAQPCRRAGRRRADRGAAGAQPHTRAAARRAGPERGAARAWRDRDARVPAGRRPERSRRGGAPQARAARVAALPHARRAGPCCSSARSSPRASSSSTRARASAKASPRCSSSSTRAVPPRCSRPRGRTSAGRWPWYSSRRSG